MGLNHLQRLLAEDAQTNSQAGLRVDDIVDGTPEGEVGELPRRDEVDLGLEQVAAGCGVDQSAQERDLGAVEGAPPRVDGALYEAVAKENRQLVLLDSELGQLADVRIRPLEEDLVLGLIGPRDELAPYFTTKDSHL